MDCRTNQFETAAQQACQDKPLREALRRATTHFQAKRKAAFEGLPDVEAHKKRVRETRLRTLFRLPELLTELERKVQANGGVVHWAEDGPAAATPTHAQLARMCAWARRAGWDEAASALQARPLRLEQEKLEPQLPA